MKSPNVPNWRGIQPASLLTGPGVTPPASVTFLSVGDALTLGAGLCYAQPALMFEGNTASSGTVRRIGLVIGPAARFGRAHLTRCSGPDAATPQAAATVGTTTGGYGVDDVATVASAMTGAELYMDTGSVAVTVAILVSGDAVVPSPAQPGDRALPLAEGLAATVEELEVSHCAGFGLSVTHWAPDLEAL